MINALNLIGFTSLEALLISAGRAELKLPVKYPAGLGFSTLANLRGIFQTVAKLFKNNGLPDTPLTNKKKRNQTLHLQLNQTTKTSYTTQEP